MAKKKINDDTLLQLIRHGNSPAGAARFFVGGKLRKCSAREDKTRHQLQPLRKSDVAAVHIGNDLNMLMKGSTPALWD